MKLDDDNLIDDLAEASRIVALLKLLRRGARQAGLLDRGARFWVKPNQVFGMGLGFIPGYLCLQGPLKESPGAVVGVFMLIGYWVGSMVGIIGVQKRWRNWMGLGPVRMCQKFGVLGGACLGFVLLLEPIGIWPGWIVILFMLIGFLGGHRIKLDD